jgi:hypothetical protein
VFLAHNDLPPFVSSKYSTKRWSAMFSYGDASLSYGTFHERDANVKDPASLKLTKKAKWRSSESIDQ